MADPRMKSLKIKSNVVKRQENVVFNKSFREITFIPKRIIKEKSTYEKEVIQTEEKIAKMKSDGKDEYDIKKMVTNLNKSKTK